MLSHCLPPFYAVSVCFGQINRTLQSICLHLQFWSVTNLIKLILFCVIQWSTNKINKYIKVRGRDINKKLDKLKRNWISHGSLNHSTFYKQVVRWWKSFPVKHARHSVSFLHTNTHPIYLSTLPWMAIKNCEKWEFLAKDNKVTFVLYRYGGPLHGWKLPVSFTIADGY